MALSDYWVFGSTDDNRAKNIDKMESEEKKRKDRLQLNDTQRRNNHFAEALEEAEFYGPQGPYVSSLKSLFDAQEFQDQQVIAGETPGPISTVSGTDTGEAGQGAATNNQEPLEVGQSEQQGDTEAMEAGEGPKAKDESFDEAVQAEQDQDVAASFMDKEQRDATYRENKRNMEDMGFDGEYYEARLGGKDVLERHVFSKEQLATLEALKEDASPIGVALAGLMPFKGVFARATQIQKMYSGLTRTQALRKSMLWSTNVGARAAAIEAPLSPATYEWAEDHPIAGHAMLMLQGVGSFVAANKMFSAEHAVEGFLFKKLADQTGNIRFGGKAGMDDVLEGAKLWAAGQHSRGSKRWAAPRTKQIINDIKSGTFTDPDTQQVMNHVLTKMKEGSLSKEQADVVTDTAIQLANTKPISKLSFPNGVQDIVDHTQGRFSQRAVEQAYREIRKEYQADFDRDVADVARRMTSSSKYQDMTPAERKQRATELVQREYSTYAMSDTVQKLKSIERQEVLEAQIPTTLTDRDFNKVSAPSGKSEAQLRAISGSYKAREHANHESLYQRGVEEGLDSDGLANLYKTHYDTSTESGAYTRYQLDADQYRLRKLIGAKAQNEFQATPEYDPIARVQFNPDGTMSYNPAAKNLEVVKATDNESALFKLEGAVTREQVDAVIEPALKAQVLKDLPAVIKKNSIPVKVDGKTVDIASPLAAIRAANIKGFQPSDIVDDVRTTTHPPMAEQKLALIRAKYEDVLTRQPGESDQAYLVRTKSVQDQLKALKAPQTTKSIMPAAKIDSISSAMLNSNWQGRPLSEFLNEAMTTAEANKDSKAMRSIKKLLFSQDSFEADPKWLIKQASLAPDKRSPVYDVILRAVKSRADQARDYLARVHGLKDAEHQDKVIYNVIAADDIFQAEKAAHADTPYYEKMAYAHVAWRESVSGMQPGTSASNLRMLQGAIRRDEMDRKAVQAMENFRPEEPEAPQLLDDVQMPHRYDEDGFADAQTERFIDSNPLYGVDLGGSRYNSFRELAEAMSGFRDNAHLREMGMRSPVPGENVRDDYNTLTIEEQTAVWQTNEAMETALASRMVDPLYDPNTGFNLLRMNGRADVVRALQHLPVDDSLSLSPAHVAEHTGLRFRQGMSDGEISKHWAAMNTLAAQTENIAGRLMSDNATIMDAIAFRKALTTNNAVMDYATRGGLSENTLKQMTAFDLGVHSDLDRYLRMSKIADYNFLDPFGDAPGYSMKMVRAEAELLTRLPDAGSKIRFIRDLNNMHKSKHYNELKDRSEKLRDKFERMFKTNCGSLGRLGMAVGAGLTAKAAGATDEEASGVGAMMGSVHPCIREAIKREGGGKDLLEWQNVNKQQEVRTMEGLTSIYMANILSSGNTLANNAFGGLTGLYTRLADDTFAMGYSQANTFFNKRLGTEVPRDQVIPLSNTVAQVSGIADGVKDIFRFIGSYSKGKLESGYFNEESPTAANTLAGMGVHPDILKGVKIQSPNSPKLFQYLTEQEGWMGALGNSLTFSLEAFPKALQGTDMMVKMVHYNISLNTFLNRKAISVGGARNHAERTAYIEGAKANLARDVSEDHLRELFREQALDYNTDESGRIDYTGVWDDVYNRMEQAFIQGGMDSTEAHKYARRDLSSRNMDFLKASYSEGGAVASGGYYTLTDQPTSRLGKLMNTQLERKPDRGSEYADPEDGWLSYMISDGARAAFQVLEPFRRIGIRMLGQAADHNPLAPFMDEVTRRDWNAGGIRRANAVGRVLHGSMLLGGLMYFSEYLKGDSSRDANKRQIEIREGIKPNSINVGDVSLPFHRLGNLEVLFNYAAAYREYQDMLAAKNQKTVGGIDTPQMEGWQYVQPFISAAYDNNWTGHLGRTISALSEAKNSTIPGRLGRDAAQRARTVVTPAWLQHIMDETDNEIRAPEGVLENMQALIPGMSENLPSRIDQWGKPFIKRAQYGDNMYQGVTEEELKAGSIMYEIDYDPPKMSQQITVDPGDGVSIPVKINKTEEEQILRFAGQGFTVVNPDTGMIEVDKSGAPKLIQPWAHTVLQAVEAHKRQRNGEVAPFVLREQLKALRKQHMSLAKQYFLYRSDPESSRIWQAYQAGRADKEFKLTEFGKVRESQRLERSSGFKSEFERAQGER